MRKWAAALTCAALFASAAGCSRSGDDDSASSTTTADATDTTSSADDARALAEAALLGTASLPARWAVRGDVTDATASEPEPCTGVEPVAAKTRSYRRGEHALPSARLVVSVYATEAQATAAVNASASRQFAACVAERFTRPVPDAPKYTVTSSARFEVPKLGDQRVAVRIALRATNAGEEAQLTLDAVSIRRGRAVLRLEIAFGDVFPLTDAAAVALWKAADGAVRDAVADSDE